MSLQAKISELREKMVTDASDTGEIETTKPIVTDPEVSTPPVTAQDGEPGDGDEEELELLNDLPSALNIDSNEFYKLKLKTDTGHTYTLSEVKDKLQQWERKQEDFSARETAIREREQTLLRQLTEIPAQRNEKIALTENQLGGVLAAKQNLIKFLSTDTDNLPANELVKYQTQLMQLTLAEEELNTRLRVETHEYETSKMQALSEYRQKQLELLTQKIPEFADTEKRAVLATDMKDFLTREGFTAQEISQMIDARHATVAYKAMLWDKHKKDVELAKTNLKAGKLNRLVRGSSPTSDTENKRLDSVISRGTSSRREADKRAAFTAVARKAGLIPTE